jgi:SAM-dependent methyltransferase
LARHFLLIDDDCLFGRPVARSDFLLADGRPVVYLDEVAVPDDPDGGPGHDRGLAYTRRLIVGWLGDESAIRVFAHAPQLLDRELLAALERLWPEEVRRASQATFRSPRTLVLRLLYPAAAVAGVSGTPPAVPLVLHSGSPEYSIVRLRPDPVGVLRDMSHMARRQSRFICVNDELGPGKIGRDLGRTVELLLGRMYQEPSSFELDGQELPTGAQAVDRDAAVHWSNRLSDNWSDAGVGSLAYGEQFNAWRNRTRVKVMRRAVRELELDLTATRVLEVGAGTGLHLREWIRLGVRQVAAVDIAEPAVRRLRAELPDVELRQADVGGGPLPFPPGSFDVACAFAVLFHIVDDRRYRQALANMSAVIRPGGYLLMSESPLPSGERRAGDYWAARSDAFIEAAIAAAGLEPVSCRAEAVLMSPPQRLGSGWTALWERLMQPVGGRERVGWAVGAAAYPLELALTATLRRGPSTSLFVCRKPG